MDFMRIFMPVIALTGKVFGLQFKRVKFYS